MITHEWAHLEVPGGIWPIATAKDKPDQEKPRKLQAGIAGTMEEA